MRIVCWIVVAMALALPVHAGQGMDAYVAGLDALERAGFQKSVEHLLRAVQAEPDNADFHFALGVACVLHEKLGLGLKHLERAQRLRPSDKHIKLWRATGVAMEGRFREDGMIYPPVTRDAYETEVRAMSRRYGWPTYARIELNQPDPQEKQKQAAERKSFGALAKKFVARVKPKNARLGKTLRARGIANSKRTPKSAYRDLSVVLKANPDDHEVRYHLALCELQLGAPEAARRNLTICLTANHRWADAYAARAGAHLHLYNDAGAQTDFAIAKKYGHKAKGLGPRPASTTADDATQIVQRVEARRRRADERYQDRLRRLHEAGNLADLGAFLYEESQVTLTERVEPRSQARPFRAKHEGRELKAAERALDAALAQNKNDVKALAYRAACHVRRGDVRNARAKIERAIDLDPAHPDVLTIVAHVLEYAARVNNAAAQGLRAVDTWEDSRYIYYRYPSKAELAQAAALEREARRLAKRARAGLQAAIARSQGTPRGSYYRGLLAEWDGNYKAALEAQRAATKADPRFRRAWIKRMELCRRLRQEDERYEAEFAAANLDHTTAAPLLKLAWLHIRRTAFVKARAVLERARSADEADPRCAAYLGVVEELAGNSVAAAHAFQFALRLHDAGARLRGPTIDPESKLEPAVAARRMTYALRGALALPAKDAERARALLETAAQTYGRVERYGRYEPTPRAMLPTVPEDAGRRREPSTVEMLGTWVVLRFANALARQGKHDLAVQNYRWISKFEERKPPNRPLGERIREPVALARIYVAQSLLALGKRQEAKEAYRSFGVPPNRISNKAVVEFERVRRQVEEALGADVRRPQTLREARRQALLKQRGELVARKAKQERILRDKDASAQEKTAAQIEIADLGAKIERLDQEIARVNRGR